MRMSNTELAIKMATAAKILNKDSLYMKAGCWERTILLDLLAFLFTYFIYTLLTQFSVAQPTVHTGMERKVSE